MVRQSVFCLKICVFSKSRIGENEKKTALLREKSRGDSKTGKPKYGRFPWFQGISGLSASLTLNSCATASSGSSFAMTTSR